MLPTHTVCRHAHSLGRSRCGAEHLRTGALQRTYFRLQLVVLLLNHPLLDADGLHHSNRPLDVLVSGRTILFVLLASAGALAGGQLLARKAELLLGARDLIQQLALVEGLLSYHLAAQILNLCAKSALDCLVFFAHNFAPDVVQLVQDRAHCCFGHLAIELLLDLKNCAHSLRGNPVVAFLGLVHVPIGRATTSPFISFKRVLDALRSLKAGSGGRLKNICVFHVGVLAGSSEEIKEALVVGLERLHFDLETALALAALV